MPSVTSATSPLSPLQVQKTILERVTVSRPNATVEVIVLRLSPAARQALTTRVVKLGRAR